jgi:hypothetical protein
MNAIGGAAAVGRMRRCYWEEGKEEDEEELLLGEKDARMLCSSAVFSTLFTD